MQAFVFCFIFCLAVSTVTPYEVIENEYGQQYYMVPLSSRHKRETPKTETKIELKGPPVRVEITHEGKIFENDRHKVDASAYANKPFVPDVPPTSGGKVDYHYKPNGSGATIQVDHTRHQGTDAKATATLNLFKFKDFRFDLSQEYLRRFGTMSPQDPEGWTTYVRAHAKF